MFSRAPRQGPAAAHRSSSPCRGRRRRLIDHVASPRLVAVGAQAGGVHRVDADIGAVRGIYDAEEEALHRGRNRYSFGKEHEALTSRQPAERGDDGEETVRRGVALLIALHRVEACDHARLHFRQLRLGARAVATGGGVWPGCRRGGDWVWRHGRRPADAGAPLLPLGAVVAGCGTAGHLVQRLPQYLCVPRKRRIGRERQVDGEDSDIAGSLFLVAEIALRGLHREALRFRRQSIENERGDDRSVVDAPAATRRCAGCTGGRAGGRTCGSRRRIAQKRRERSDLLRTPSSSTSKSAAVRSRTGWPLRSRTTTSTRTARTPSTTVPARGGACCLLRGTARDHHHHQELRRRPVAAVPSFSSHRLRAARSACAPADRAV